MQLFLVLVGKKPEMPRQLSYSRQGVEFLANISLEVSGLGQGTWMVV